MKTFIRVAEVWVPDADRSLLEFGGGLYGNALSFGAASRSMCFGRGEGLPGRVWEEGRPIVLQQLQGGYFQRAAAAKSAGLSCAVAMPVFFGEVLNAVVVFFCGGDDAQTGAIELWRNDPRISTDMTLVDGYYGATAAAFLSASRETSLPRGAGLPGMAWQSGGSVFIDGLSSSARFLRAAEADAAGIRHGLALPCPVPSADQYVLSFLSASATPIARRIEGWVPDAEGKGLQRAYGLCESAGTLPTGPGETTSGSGEDTIAEAFASGVPRLRQRAGDEPGAVGASAAAAGLGGLIVLPVINEGAVSEAVALYF